LPLAVREVAPPRVDADHELAVVNHLLGVSMLVSTAVGLLRRTLAA
jgi:hypothetical protein